MKIETLLSRIVYSNRRSNLLFDGTFPNSKILRIVTLPLVTVSRDFFCLAKQAGNMNRRNVPQLAPFGIMQFGAFCPELAVTKQKCRYHHFLASIKKIKYNSILNKRVIYNGKIIFNTLFITRKLTQL